MKLSYLKNWSTQEKIAELASFNPLKLVKVSRNDFSELFKNSKINELTSYFKTGYNVIERKNNKLGYILNFSLLPVITCSQHCSGCYDIISLRYVGVREKRIINTILAMHHIYSLENMISSFLDKEIKKTEKPLFRIHVGGDFFSQRYITLWSIITKTYHNKVTFYSYTKKIGIYLPHVNIVNSFLPNGEYNFADIETVKKYSKKYSIPVCPVTLGIDKKCSNCKICTTRKNVLFVKH